MGKVSSTLTWQQLEIVFSLPATHVVPVTPDAEAPPVKNFWQMVAAVPITVLSAAFAGVMDAKHPCRSCPGCVDSEKGCLVRDAFMAGMNRHFEGTAERASSLCGVEFGLAD